MIDPRWREGDRHQLCALQIERYSHYQAPDKRNGGTFTKHRYAMLSPTGERFVYSGRWLGVVEGVWVDVRATVKALEVDYKCIRLCRVRVEAVYNTLPGRLL